MFRLELSYYISICITWLIATWSFATRGQLQRGQSQRYLHRGQMQCVHL